MAGLSRKYHIKISMNYSFSGRLPHLLLISSRNFLRSSSDIFIHFPLHGDPPKEGFPFSIFPSVFRQFLLHLCAPFGLPPKFPKRIRHKANKPTACQYLIGPTFNMEGIMAFHNHITTPPSSNAAARPKMGNMRKRLLYIFR